MWKKGLVLILALIGCVSVVYAMNTELYAMDSASTYAVQANVIGRINKAPSGITGSNIKLKKGDKFYLQTKNPMNQSDLGWIILGDANTFYVTATTEPIAESTATDTSPTYKTLYKTSNVYKEIHTFDTKFKESALDTSFLMDRPINCIDKVNNYSHWDNTNYGLNSKDLVNGFDSGKTLYAFSSAFDKNWVSTAETPNITFTSAGSLQNKDFDFSTTYWTGAHHAQTPVNNGSPGKWGSWNANGSNGLLPYDEVHAIRPGAALNLSSVVFGVSVAQNQTGNIANVTEYSLPTNYTGLYASTQDNDIMKLRVENTSDPISVTLTDIVNTFGNSITAIEKDSTILMKARAENKGTTVSVLLFKDNKFMYYAPLASAKGDDTDYAYAFDTTGIEPGTYKIAIVNEVYDSTTTAPAYSSLLSDTKTLTITNKNGMSALKFSALHSGKNDLTDINTSTSSGNCKENDILGHLSVSDGVGNPDKISYILLNDTSHSDDYLKLEIPYNVNTKYPILEANKPYVKVKDPTGLSSGIYTFRIQAYDENGNPFPAVDQNGTKITDTSILSDAKKVQESPHYNENDDTKDKVHGIISDDIRIVVYPHASQITYKQYKDANNAYYQRSDVNDASFTSHLGELVFGSDADTYANMQELYDAGYRINTSTSKLMKKGSTSDAYTEFKITSDATKPYQFYIDKANNNVTAGDHEFDAWLYFTNGSGDTALLKLKNQNLYIAPSLSYIHPDKNTEFLSTDTYTRKYNAYASSDQHENKFHLIATDKEDLSTNAKVQYCLLDEVTKACASTNANDVVDIIDNGNGTATLTTKPYHKSDPDIKVRAYIEDAQGTILTYEDITIQINRAERKLKWEGKKISSLQSNVTDKGTDYELKLPYDASNPISYSFDRIANMVDALTDGKLALRHDAGTGTINYTLNGNLSAGDSTDSFKISNQCTGTTCYIEITKAQDDLFEAGKVRLYITTEDMAEIEDAQVGWVYSTNGTTWQNTGNPLEFTYKKDGTYPVKINADLLPSDITDLDITYTLDDPDSLGTITVANKTDSKTEAKLDIVKANQTAANPRIKAEIKSSNYAQKIVYLPVKIKKLNQTLEFEDTAFKNLSTNIKLNPSTTYDYSAILKVDATTQGGGSISYTVSGEPVDMITNDSTAHFFTVSKVGTVTITATVTDDMNHNTTTANKSITKTITFYDDAGISWTQSTPKPEAVNTVFSTPTGDAKTNKELGEIKIDGGKDSNYTFTIENTKHSDDSTFFIIVKDATNKAGTLKLLKDVDATALNTHSTQISASDEYEWQIHVKAVGVNDPTDVAEGDITITFIGAEPEITFTKANTDKKIIDIYKVNGTLDLSVKRDDVSVSDPTINLTGYSGVIETTGAIKSANTDNEDNVRSGRKVELTAQVTASGGYKTGTSPKNEVIIKKAEHPTIDFTSTTLSSSNNVDVGIEGILHSTNKANEDVSITPIKAEESDPWLIDTFTMSKDQAYASPSIAVSPKGYIGVVEFNVTASGDDNYKPIPENTKITLEFTEAGGIIYKPIEITYGDNTKEVLSYITSPNPSDDPATVSYTYTGYDTSLIEVDADGKITTKHVGETYITLKRTDSADNSEMEQRIKVKVKPKEIIIQPKDIHKKVGELITNAEYELDTEKSGSFLEGDDIGTLVFSCQDNNVEVVDLVDGLKGPQELSISVTHTGGTASDKQNYTILYKTATLYITQDTGLESWVSVIPQSGTELHNGWYNGPVDVKITAMAGSYEEISPDGNAPWAEKFGVSEEGKTMQDVYFRDPATLAKASKIIKEIKIDSIDPKVMKITAKSSNNKLEDILNTLTGGIFFKPGTEFTLTTSDRFDTSVKDTSGTKEVSYSMYRIKGIEEEEIVKNQVLAIQDETGKIKISDSSGTYKVCTKAKDNAENEQETEACAKVTIGFEDVNISTGEGNCPDLNLDFNDDGEPELNIDLDGDGIPDLNIDSDFDGEPDINVDSDRDGRPDINLVILDTWKPGICNIVEGKEYATQERIVPQINVVIDNGEKPIKEQIPSINIDTDGDMKADLNITNEKGELYLNILPLKEWKPETNHTHKKFQYDTINWKMPLTNYDSDKDGKPDINIDFDSDGIPDLNIDSDYDGIPDLNIDGDGDGKPDYNLDADENGKPQKNIIQIDTWEPTEDGEKEFAFDTMKITGKDELEDNGIIVEKPDGSFLPNHAIKVEDITEGTKDTVQSEASNQISDKQEVKAVYDVKLLEEGVEVQPDGSITVRIPIPDGIENPKLLVKKANGAYEEVKAKVENGYLVYETEELGIVSVIGDKGKDTNVKEDPDTPKKPSTSVQGNYTTQAGTTSGMGGAYTGDSTHIERSIWILISSIILLVYVVRRHRAMHS